MPILRGGYPGYPHSVSVYHKTRRSVCVYGTLVYGYMVVCIWCSVRVYMGVGAVSNVVQFPVKVSVPVSNPVSESYSMDLLRLQYMMAMRNMKVVK